MECRFAEQRLQALVDEELTPLDLQETLDHVASCAECAQALHELHEVASLGKQVYRTELSTDAAFVEGVLKRAEDIRLASSDATGRKIGGYEIISKLGTGAMGAVYLARQVSLDRTVALKVLPQSMVKDKEFAERFIREARATAKLSHENVVHGIDAGRVGDVYYFAMEYVEGLSLRDIIRKRKRLPEAEAVDICLQMAKALEHAGKMGLIHRDIKPDNILVTSDGVAKLCDLGLARAESEDAHLTQDGFVVGTPHYIAPEQARGEENIDARADIYALGSTLYMMVAGEVPFDGSTSAIVMARHITDPFPDPRTLVPEISDAFVTVLFRMVAKEKSDRYRTASALRADLEALRTGRLKSDTRLKQQAPGGSTSRARRALAQRVRRSRTPSPASILLAGGALVAGIAAVMIAFTGSRSTNRDTNAPAATGTASRPAASEADSAREASATALVEIIRQRFADEPTMAEDHLQLLDDAMPAIAGTRSEVDAMALRTRLTRATRAEADEHVRRAIDSAKKLTQAERFDLALAAGGPLDRDEAPALAKRRIDTERARILTAAQELLDSRLNAAGDMATMSEAEFMAKVVGLPLELAARAETDYRHAREFAAASAADTSAERPVDATAGHTSLAMVSREINLLVERGNLSGARRRLAEARRDGDLADARKQLSREDAFLNSVEDANGALIAALQDLVETHATVSLKTREGKEAIRGQVEDFSKDTMRLDLTETMGNARARSSVDINKLDSAYLAGLIRSRFTDDATGGARAAAAFFVSRGELAEAEKAYRQLAAEDEDAAGALERLIDVRRAILSDLFHCAYEPGENGIAELVYDFRDAGQLQDWEAQALPGDAAPGGFEHSVADNALRLKGLVGVRTKAAFVGDVSLEITLTLSSDQEGAAALIHVDDARPHSFYAAIAGFMGKAYLETWNAGLPHVAGKMEVLPSTRETTVSLARTAGNVRFKVGDGPECTHFDRQYNSGSVALVSLGSEVRFSKVRIRGVLDPDWLAAALSTERNRLACATPMDSEK